MVIHQNHHNYTKGLSDIIPNKKKKKKKNSSKKNEQTYDVIDENDDTNMIPNLFNLSGVETSCANNPEESVVGSLESLVNNEVVIVKDCTLEQQEEVAGEDDPKDKNPSEKETKEK